VLIIAALVTAAGVCIRIPRTRWVDRARPSHRRFGLALLVGWIGGAAAILAWYFYFLACTLRDDRWGIGSQEIVAFGFMLLALLVVAVLLARDTDARR
jgi:hypothetical protein